MDSFKDAGNQSNDSNLPTEEPFGTTLTCAVRELVPLAYSSSLASACLVRSLVSAGSALESADPSPFNVDYELSRSCMTLSPHNAHNDALSNSCQVNENKHALSQFNANKGMLWKDSV